MANQPQDPSPQASRRGRASANSAPRWVYAVGISVIVVVAVLGIVFTPHRHSLGGHTLSGPSGVQQP